MAQTINMGSNVEIVNYVLSDSADTAIELTNKTNNILIRNRNDGEIYYRTSNGASNYFTIPSGQSLTVELGAREQTAGYLRAGTSGHVAEILSQYGSGS